MYEVSVLGNFNVGKHAIHSTFSGALLSKMRLLNRKKIHLMYFLKMVAFLVNLYFIEKALESICEGLLPYFTAM